MTYTPGSEPVAVVGAAFELPGASSWGELSAILREGRDMVRPMPKRRRTLTRTALPSVARDVGWLDDITAFDHHYFGLSRADAELVDPRQRRLMTLAVDAIGDSGQSPDTLAGSRTAVIVSALGGPRTDLYDQLDSDEQEFAAAFTGSLHACIAGRIAYHLDLRGAAMTIDTACSSFLVCVHEACAKLRSGEADYALVGAYTAVLGEPPAPAVSAAGVGVESPTARSRPFDEDADGAGIGEGGGAFLLRRASDVDAENGSSYCVVLGSAVNHDGHRGSGLVAPSPPAQTELLLDAWARADVPAEALGYLEAHGTGTKVGDPIEMQGIVHAFEQAGRDSEPCPISSVKGNFGHLGGAAGAAGLLRVVAQMRDQRIYPTAHFRRPSSLLPPHAAYARVTDVEREWAGADVMRRIAGISGFGLSGTNAHVMIEEGRPACVQSPPDRVGQLVMLSARSPALLLDEVQQLVEMADASDFDFDGVCRVLRAGRRPEAFRLAFVAEDPATLRAKLANALDVLPEPAPVPSKVVLAFGTPPPVSPEDLVALGSRSHAIGQLLAALQPSKFNAQQLGLVWQVAQHASLLAHGVNVASVIGHGGGLRASRVLRGEVTLSEALAGAADDESPIDPARLRTALIEDESKVLVVDLAPGSTLSKAMSGLELVNTFATTGTWKGFLELLAVLYLDGQSLSWDDEPTGARSPRPPAPLPGLFERTCWPETTRPTDAGPNRTSTAERPAPRTPREALLAHARRILKDDELTLEDDFFARGGDSLNGMRLLFAVNEETGLELHIGDLLACDTLGDLALLSAGSASMSPSGSGARRGPLTGQQLAIWAALDQPSERVGTYNVPGAFVFRGPDADPERISLAISDFTRRQPMLRAVLARTDGLPEQEVLDFVPPSLRRVQIECDPGADLAEALLRSAQELIRNPLNAEGHPPTKWWLVDVTAGAERRRMLVMCFHHLFFDGWSWRILFDQLGRDLPELDDGVYIDRAVAQGELLDDHGDRLDRFWTDQLSQAPGDVDLADALDAPGQPGAGGRTHVFELDPRCIIELREIARAHRVTLGNIFCACWVVALWQLTAERDLVVAINVAGRGSRDEDIVGCFVNTVPVRFRIKPDGDFADLLRSVRDATSAALAHAQHPYNRILRAWQAAVGAEVQPASMFDFQPQVQAPDALAGLPGEMLVELSPPGSKQSLSFSCVDLGAAIYAAIEFDCERIAPEGAQRIADTVTRTLEQVARTAGTFHLLDLGENGFGREAQSRSHARGFRW